jgi:hypothetical protein
MVEACSMHVGEEKYIGSFDDGETCNRLLGKHTYRWEDNIQIDLSEMGLKGLEWTHLDQNREK